METVEVLVRIPKTDLDKVYDCVKMGLCSTNFTFDIAFMAIANGTVLPKGHGDLKDENEIKQMIENAKVKSESSKTFAENIIKFAPTVIEADKDGE